MDVLPCTRCGAPRDSTNRAQKSGLDPRCKKCHREIQQARRDAGLNQQRERYYKLQQKYGISQQQWEQMLSDQHEACAICAIPFKDGPYNGRICVDHCHKTNRVRGLLCVDCNHGLGKFKDDSARLRQAADYLDRTAGG